MILRPAFPDHHDPRTRAGQEWALGRIQELYLIAQTAGTEKVWAEVLDLQRNYGASTRLLNQWVYWIEGFEC